MSALFLYGTLLHDPTRQAVLGDVPTVPARLTDHAVFWAGEEAYPRIAEAPGEVIEGLLIEGAEARARLDYYEGGYGYAVRTVEVATEEGLREAELYWPGADVPAPGARWSVADWAARWGAMNVHVAREAMAYYGELSASELAAKMPGIRMRAHARFLAETLPAPAPLAPVPVGAVETLIGRWPYANYFAVREDDLRHPRFDGAQSPVVNRAAFIAADAVVVLPYDPVRDRVHLIEQFRVGPHFRGDPNTFVIECIAGRIDPGESPEDAVHREAWEEGSLTFRSLHLASRSYPSPGAFTEFLHIYIGITDLPDEAAGMGGKIDEDEDIRSTILPFAEFEERLDTAGLNIGPLIVAGLWLSRHRERLRREA